VGAFRSHLTAKTVAVAAATTIGTRISVNVKSPLEAPAIGVVAVSTMVSTRVALVAVAYVFVIVAVGIVVRVVVVVVVGVLATMVVVELFVSCAVAVGNPPATLKTAQFCAFPPG